MNCPICGKRMEKVQCGAEKKIRVDKCRRNHGIWFDKGELEGIISQVGAETESKVLNLLRDMFSKKIQE